MLHEILKDIHTTAEIIRKIKKRTANKFIFRNYRETQQCPRVHFSQKIFVFQNFSFQ